MKTAARKFIFVVFTSVIASCASRHAPTVRQASPIRSIAIVTGNPLASAIGIELFNQGFRTFEAPPTQELTPKALQSLASGGVDGVLVVRTTGRKYDPLPESASVRLIRTRTGETVAALNWSNPASGGAGSPLDPAVRKSVTDVARELVQTLLKTVAKPAA